MTIVLWIIFAPLLIYLGIVGILAFLTMLLRTGGFLAVIAMVIFVVMFPPLIFLVVILIVCLGVIGFIYQLCK